MAIKLDERKRVDGAFTWTKMFATRMLTLDLFARANLIVDIHYIFGTGNDLPTAASFFQRIRGGQRFGS